MATARWFSGKRFGSRKLPGTIRASGYFADDFTPLTARIVDIDAFSRAVAGLVIALGLLLLVHLIRMWVIMRARLIVLARWLALAEHEVGLVSARVTARAQFHGNAMSGRMRRDGLAADLAYIHSGNSLKHSFEAAEFSKAKTADVMF
jgi:hypothetical protein